MRYWLILFFLTFSAQSLAEKATPLSLGIFPHLPLYPLHKRYTSLASYLSKQLKHPVTLKTKSSCPEFRTALTQEEYDIALVQPFDYLIAHDQHHYKPLARKDTPLRAVLMVKKDSLFHTLDDLKQQEIVSPPKLTAITQLFSRHLKQHHYTRDDFLLKHKANNFDCLHAVLLNQAQACVTAPHALHYRGTQEIHKNFRKIIQTDPIPHMVFVAHQRLPDITRQRVKDIIINWGKSPEGKAMAQQTKLNRFVAATDEDYNILRSPAYPPQ
jgi:phosphonate transport system substrate-binding protein